MPVFSLPSPRGIGTLGKAARDFIDFLEAADQRWWQILPVGPTSYGDSPYQSPSAFAGNPYLIDPDLLVSDGLLTEDEVDAVSFGDDPGTIDYGLLYERRPILLKKAFERGRERDSEAFAAFENENAAWLADYSLFMAIKEKFGMVSWTKWPDEALRLREPSALAACREELKEEISYHSYVQFLFFRQWDALKSYAAGKGIGIIGDIPLYVALDSSDVWASPENFLLDKERLPIEVAGVPPDYFTADGQLWGNPLYDYGRMEEDGFSWWIRRVGGAARLYDAVRIDHFRGLESYWAVPYGDTTARRGRWVKGPGMKLIGALKESFPDVFFIAEDLGYPSPEVVQLISDSGFPGMKVLEFAFDSRDSSSYLPHTYYPNCICYTGTHDNETLSGWRRSAAPEDFAVAVRYLGLNDSEGIERGIIRGGMSSVARLFVAQMQDYLELGDEARINTPGTMAGNWRWRMLPGALSGELAKSIAEMTKLYGRSTRHVRSES